MFVNLQAQRAGWFGVERKGVEGKNGGLVAIQKS